MTKGIREVKAYYIIVSFEINKMFFPEYETIYVSVASTQNFLEELNVFNKKKEFLTTLLYRTFVDIQPYIKEI